MYFLERCVFSALGGGVESMTPTYVLELRTRACPSADSKYNQVVQAKLSSAAKRQTSQTSGPHHMSDRDDIDIHLLLTPGICPSSG